MNLIIQGVNKVSSAVNYCQSAVKLDIKNPENKIAVRNDFELPCHSKSILSKLGFIQPSDTFIHNEKKIICTQSRMGPKLGPIENFFGASFVPVNRCIIRHQLRTSKVLTIC